jgi:hypothetical protein
MLTAKQHNKIIKMDTLKNIIAPGLVFSPSTHEVKTPIISSNIGTMEVLKT